MISLTKGTTRLYRTQTRTGDLEARLVSAGAPADSIHTECNTPSLYAASASSSSRGAQATDADLWPFSYRPRGTRLPREMVMPG